VSKGTGLNKEAAIVPMLVAVDDEEAHLSYSLMRAHESRNRPSERYLDFFDNIRKLQEYLKSMALPHGVPVVPYNLDTTLSQVIDLVAGRAIDAVPAAERNNQAPREVPDEC
jgi:2-phosphoglycerate kinase